MDTGRAALGPAGVLDSASRSRGRAHKNHAYAVDMPDCAAVVESWWEVRIHSISRRHEAEASCLFSLMIERRNKNGRIRGNSKEGKHKKVEIDAGGEREDHKGA